MRRLVAVALAVAIAACATTRRRASMPAPAREWLTTLEMAKLAAADGRFDDADRALYDYTQRYADAPEAREATYWRALFKLDPANRAASTHVAEEHLRSYLDDTVTTLHRTEALALRRIALALDSLNRSHRIASLSSDAARAEEAAKAHQREEELQKELQHLKDSLVKTTAELQRIKKRLSEKNP